MTNIDFYEFIPLFSLESVVSFEKIHQTLEMVKCLHCLSKQLEVLFEIFFLRCILYSLLSI